ncbi:MAG: hypothetical protein AAFS10_14590 [Myxococcota bacterium]
MMHDPHTSKVKALRIVSACSGMGRQISGCGVGLDNPRWMRYIVFIKQAQTIDLIDFSHLHLR